MTNRLTTVGIVNFETRDDLAACLRSLPAGGPVVVVDNASTDGSAPMVRREFPHVQLFASDENLGYGAAANTAMAMASTPYLLLLNADVRLHAGAVETLTDHLEQNPEVGLVGPQVVDGGGLVQSTRHADPTPLSVFVDSSGLLELGRRVGLSRTPERRAEPDWVLGAAMAIRRTAFEAVGGFDPTYFLYFEEIDLARRLRNAGWAVGYEPDAQVAHDGGSSTGRTPVESERHHYRSGARWFAMHGNKGQRRRYQFATAAAMASRWVTSPLAPHPPSRRDAARAVVADALADWPIKSERDDANQRADWRTILPWPPGDPTVHLDPIGDSAWLAEDGWLVGDDEHAPATVELNSAPSRQTPDTPIVAWRRQGWRAQFAHWRRLGALRRSGYHNIRTYWAVPDFDHCRRLIPLDIDEPLRWWGNNLAADRRLARLIAGQSRLARRVLKILGPEIFVVASRFAQSPSHRLVVTSGHDSGSRAVVVEFVAGTDQPTAIEKWANRPKSNAATVREHETLEELHRTLPPELARALSRPLTQTMVGGLVVTREKPVSGVLLAARIGVNAESDPSRMADAKMLLGEACQWLIGLHDSTARDEPWSYDRWIGDLVVQLETHRPLTPAVHTLLDRIRVHTADLTPATLPTVRRHYDFGPRNLLRGERFGVIDWESAPPRPQDSRGLAGADLMYLTKNWLHLTLGEGYEAAETIGFHFLARENDPSDPRAIASAALAKYAAAAGIDLAWMPAIFVHTWLENARFDQARHGEAITGRSRAYLDTVARHGDLLLDWWTSRRRVV